MTAPAWQVRDMIRQRILEKLDRLTYEKEEELDDPYFRLKLASVILRELARREESHGAGPILYDLRPTTEKAGHFFQTVIIPELRIGYVMRSQGESTAILARFLTEHVLPPALDHFRNELHSEEHKKPELIFGAKRATDEIPIPDNE